MDNWRWQQLDPWLKLRMELPVGALFCVISGPTAGRPWSAAAARTQFRRLALRAGARRRFAPHQLRHAHAVEMAREGVPLNVIQRQLGHADLGITSVYLQGIDSGEIVDVVHGRRAPVIPAAVALGPWATWLTVRLETLPSRERSSSTAMNPAAPHRSNSPSPALAGRPPGIPRLRLREPESPPSTCRYPDRDSPRERSSC